MFIPYSFLKVTSKNIFFVILYHGSWNLFYSNLLHLSFVPFKHLAFNYISVAECFLYRISVSLQKFTKVIIKLLLACLYQWINIWVTYSDICLNLYACLNQRHLSNIFQMTTANTTEEMKPRNELANIPIYTLYCIQR